MQRDLGLESRPGELTRKSIRADVRRVQVEGGLFIIHRLIAGYNYMMLWGNDYQFERDHRGTGKEPRAGEKSFQAHVWTVRHKA